jgi:hypothetical protein
VRQHTWSWEIEQEVLRLRREYPRWGKDKLAVLPTLKGKVSVSTVGRILQRLKRTGRLQEPILRAVSAGKRRKRRYAVRKPKDLVAEEPGDLVEIDTVDVSFLRKDARGGVEAFHSARCGGSMGCTAGSLSGHCHYSEDVLGCGRSEDAIQGAGDTSGRRQRIRRRV